MTYNTYLAAVLEAGTPEITNLGGASGKIDFWETGSGIGLDGREKPLTGGCTVRWVIGPL